GRRGSDPRGGLAAPEADARCVLALRWEPVSTRSSGERRRSIRRSLSAIGVKLLRRHGILLDPSRPKRYRGQLWPVYVGFPTLSGSCGRATTPILPLGGNTINGPRKGCATSDIEVGDRQCVFLNKFAARFDQIAHQLGEDRIRVVGFLDLNLEQRARIGVHGGFPKLLGVHFAQPLVALHRNALAA